MSDFLNGLLARGLARTTVESKRRHLGYFMDYLKGKEKEDIRGLTKEMMAGYEVEAGRCGVRGKGRPPVAEEVGMRLRVVKQYLNFLVDRGDLLMNPYPETPRYRKGWTPRTLLTEEEVGQLLNRPDIRTQFGLRDRAILELLYSTGLRRSELANLDIYDVDMEEGVVRVRCGKGGKDRVVPMGRMAGYWVGRYLKEVRPWWVNRSQEGLALFVGYRSERIVEISTVVKRYARRAFPQRRDITPHSFRHACATHMLRNGASVKAVQALLGHRDLSTVHVYTRLTPVDLKEAHRKSHPRGNVRFCGISPNFQGATGTVG